jgi:hypothetical protein
VQLVSLVQLAQLDLRVLRAHKVQQVLLVQLDRKDLRAMQVQQAHRDHKVLLGQLALPEQVLIKV